MKFNKGDLVEVIWRSELHQGLVEEVIELTDELMVRLDKQPLRVNYLFNQNQVRKVKLVKVPQFVADWISHCERWELWHAMDYGIDSMSEDVREWLFKAHDNQELFARAWLDGYEVEQEPLYYVKLADSGLDYLNVNKETGQKHVANKGGLTSYKTRFTESEIKDINENYWAFRVPVEEVEGE
ncbi:DUF1642 domain-containing protein [Listeria seeligeri]|uniref:DUF1642 domain-containing protein n=1 Tax=Listeria seeligeri TaxID=1640 RepID=UPI001624548D|nr:DUF1642 domain-containing protein [Listeria seeligeri]MBC1722272.1 DUF1642 domain-containing protein [Listeria seeligeri]MBF2435799.1 DUF1642 domain-containing protein [Listeria seeligeri]